MTDLELVRPETRAQDLIRRVRSLGPQIGLARRTVPMNGTELEQWSRALHELTAYCDEEMGAVDRALWVPQRSRLFDHETPVGSTVEGSSLDQAERMGMA